MFHYPRHGPDACLYKLVNIWRLQLGWGGSTVFLVSDTGVPRMKLFSDILCWICYHGCCTGEKWRHGKKFQLLFISTLNLFYLRGLQRRRPIDGSLRSPQNIDGSLRLPQKDSVNNPHPTENLDEKPSAQTRKIYGAIFVILLIDILAWTSILPLLPALLDYYGRNEQVCFYG